MQYVRYVNVMYLPHCYVPIFVYFRYFPPFHRRKDAMTFQLLTAQPQLSMCLIVELRGDIQALGLGELVERLFLRYAIRQKVAFFTELKFQPCNFLPRRLHISDGLHHVLVLFTCQLGYNAVDSVFFSLFECVIFGGKGVKTGVVDIILSSSIQAEHPLQCPVDRFLLKVLERQSR